MIQGLGLGARFYCYGLKFRVSALRIRMWGDEEMGGQRGKWYGVLGAGKGVAVLGKWNG